MQVICDSAATCKAPQCPGKKPHGKSFDWRTGKFCDEQMHKCSFMDKFVTCVTVEAKKK